MNDESDRELQEPERTTAWHPMLVTVFEQYLPLGCNMVVEFLLNRLPQRIDIVVIRRDDTVMGEISKLRSIFEHLRKHTLIEHKGPTDDLEPADVFTLLAYAGQYMRLHKVFNPEEIRLMVVADRIPKTFVKQIGTMAGNFVRGENGLWQGHLAGLSLHGVELREAYKAGASERLLYTFSQAHLDNPTGILPLDGEDMRVYSLLAQQIRQFKRQPETMALKDLELAAKSLEEVLADEIQFLPPDLVLKRIPIEQRLAGLTPEQRFAGLTPEQRFAGLTPEQIVAALPLEARELIQRLAKKSS